MKPGIWEPFIATLAARDRLSSEEVSVLVNARPQLREYPANAEIVSDRSEPTSSCLLIDGMAARALSLEGGERQLTALHIQGDFVDLHSLLLRVMDHSVLAVTPCRVAFVEHAMLRRISEDHPHLSRLLMVMIAIDASIQRNWILSLGRRSAEQRLAHLICELFLRYEIVDGVSDNGFPFAISQSTLADVLGLSIVHTNRTIQNLRTANLMTWQSRELTILDWQRLAELAQFDPLYLNLVQQKR